VVLQGQVLFAPSKQGANFSSKLRPHGFCATRKTLKHGARTQAAALMHQTGAKFAFIFRGAVFWPIFALCWHFI
jgi:hypothetical protein